MYVLCSIVFLAVLNTTMFNIALPFIFQQFALTPSEASWVVVGYSAIFAIGSVVYGKLADLYPHNLLLTIGLSLFSLGSMIGFLSSNYFLMIIGRIIQAGGGAAIPALAMIVSTHYFSIDKRGQVLGLIASIVALGTGIGPIIGGIITQYWGWKYLFLLPVLSVVAIPFINMYLPKEKTKEGSFDVIGAFLLTTFVVMMLFAINLHAYFLIAGVLSFYVFTKHIKCVKTPLIQLDLLKNKVYRTLLLMGFLVFFSIMSSFFVLPLMFKEVNNLQAIMIGFVLFPGAITAAFLGSIAGKLSDRYGDVVVIQGALFLMILGFWMISTLVGHLPIIVALFFTFVYVGYSSIQASLASFVSKTLQQHEIGVGMGLYNLSFFLGGAFGVALAGRFLELNLQVNFNPFNNVAQYMFSNVFILLGLIGILNFTLLTYVSKKLLGNVRIPT